MRNLKVVLLLVTAVLVLSGRMSADEGVLGKNGIGASGSLDYYSSYVWRGFTLDKDPVIQPGFGLSKGCFSVSFWSSFDYGNKRDMSNSSEIDYVVDYSKDFGDVSMSIGHTYYDFPGIQDYSSEFYVSAGFNAVPLTPSIAYNYDYGSGEGSYISIDASKGLGSLGSDISADLGIHIGINNELFIAGSGGDYGLTLGFGVPLLDGLDLSPTVGYAIPFGDLADELDGNQESKLYGGFSLGFSF